MVIKLKNGHKAKENVMFLNLNWKRDEFGNSLVVQWLELCFHCQLQGLSPWLGHWDPTGCEMWPENKKNSCFYVFLYLSAIVVSFMFFSFYQYTVIPSSLPAIISNLEQLSGASGLPLNRSSVRKFINLGQFKHCHWQNLGFVFCFLPHGVTCRMLVPWPGIEPVSPAVEVHSLNHWTARKVPRIWF